MIKTEYQILNDYLYEVVKNSHRCQHCKFYHDGEYCFFAYNCIKNDFNYYAEED